MAHNTLFLLILGWVCSTIILPLLLKSVERIYSDKIDMLVLFLIRLTSRLISLSIQATLIIILLPQLVFTYFLIKSNSTHVQEFIAKTELDKIQEHLFTLDFSVKKFMIFFYTQIKDEKKL